MSSESVQDNTLIYQGFMVKTIPVPTPTGFIEKLYICIAQDEPIIKTLQEMTELEELYETEIKVSPQDLYPHLKSIQNKVDAGDFSLI